VREFTSGSGTAQQITNHGDGDPSPSALPPHGRHARREREARPRPLRRRRRWLVLAVIVAAWVSMAGSAPASSDLQAVGHVADGPMRQAAWALPTLSAGAPAGAVTLSSTPTQTAEQPAGPPDITGLAANGIPNVALNAYRVAAARMGNVQPSCGIDWSLLAGIGRVESNHGRFRGAVLNPDGTSTPEIRGPALDGVQFAYIGDSDDGRFDHDTTYDRAVGSMQFIPTTWRSYAIDADGNGTTDPFDIDDAALAAANYLCVAGGNLRTDAGQRRAVLAYNHSDSYVAEVLALARAYAAGIPVEDIPLVGTTTGSVPPPSGFYWAPAAPGPAIGRDDRTPATGDTVGQSSAPAGGSGEPAASPAQPASTGPTTGQPADSGTAPGSAPQPGTAPAPGPGPQPAPAPAPVQLPAPLPPPSPSPAPAPPPPPPGQLVPGVTCNLAGTLAPILGLPVCP
jgi:membrane-bound lytic murein transglycosylase B